MIKGSYYIIFLAFYLINCSQPVDAIEAASNDKLFDKYIYVAPDGVGDGSESNPMGGIQQALEKAITFKNGFNQSTQIILFDGIYHELIDVETGSYNPDIPISIIAKNANKAILSGAYPVEGWRSGRDIDWDKTLSKSNIAWANLSEDIIQRLTEDTKSDKIYANGKVPNPWPNDVEDNGIFNNGMLIIDNNYYYPVDSNKKLAPGSFLIDYPREIIIVKLLSRIIDYQSIELAAEPTILRILNHNNLHIDGLTVINSGWALRDAAQFENIKNLRITNSKFNHNRYKGLQLHKIEDAFIEDCEVNHNGGVGASGSWEGYLRNIVFNRFKANYNNWIGYQFDFTGWDPCGVKWAGTRDLVIENSEFIGNYAAGLWLDTENRRTIIRNTIAKDNIGPGLFIEANKGPIYVSNAVLENNLRGIYLSCSENVTIDSSYISYNDYQILIFDHWTKGRGPGLFGYDFHDIDDGSSWEAHAINTHIRNTTLKNRVGQSNPLISPIFNDIEGYRFFLTSFKGADNLFKSDFPEKAFHDGDALVDLSRWQKVTDQDINSKLLNSK